MAKISLVIVWQTMWVYYKGNQTKAFLGKFSSAKNKKDKNKKKEKKTLISVVNRHYIILILGIQGLTLNLITFCLWI